VKIIARISVAVLALCWALPVGLSLYLTKTAPAITRQVPRSLIDFSTSETPRTRLSYFGREFEVPWMDIDESQTKLEARQDHQIVWVCFRSGLKLFVWITPHRKTAFDYAFLKRAYEITPDKIHYWSFSPHQRSQDQILLALKASFLQDIGLGMSSNPAETGIFDLQGNGYRGFQYGNPKVRPSMLEVRLYDQDESIEMNSCKWATMSRPE